MKIKINNIARMGMRLGFTAITALCMASPVRAGTSTAPRQSGASGKTSHGGGSGGGGFYATASTVSQLIADINYANSAGGAITINLAPGASFDLTSADNTTDGGNGLPVIGATKAVALTIIGNGDIIERIAAVSRNGTVRNPFRLFDVAAGSSLMLDKVIVKGGWTSGSGGAILNRGTLNVINGSILLGNSGYGGGIYNAGGTVTFNSSNAGDGLENDNGTMTVRASTLSGGGLGNGGGTVTVSDTIISGGGIYNGGTMAISGSTVSGGISASAAIVNASAMTVSNSTVSGHDSFYGYYGGGFNNTGSGATLLINNSTVSGNTARFGGGIYNDAGTIMIQDSTVSDNSTYHYDYPWAGGYGGGIYNNAGTIVINHSVLTGNTADPGLEDPSVGGGGIFNDSQGTVTVENESQITGNLYDDVTNFFSVLQVDGTCTIGSLVNN